MATLQHLQTGDVVPLAARHVVGRSRHCQLQIDASNVSALHAELTWDGRAWHLRDLGSRNGSFVGSHRVPAGGQVMLMAGSELGFGAPESLYRFADGAPPQLIAFGPRPNQARVADGDVLCLPTASDYEVMIFRDSDDRWVLESPDGTRPLDDEVCIVVGGLPFYVHLPGEVRATRDAVEPSGDSFREPTLEFQVSRDGEHVDLRLCEGARRQLIESRAHAFLLLALARARLADRAAGELPDTEHGWTHREDLMKQLAIQDPQLLNLWVYRARQQLAQMKLPRVSKIIERREGAGQLRLGLASLRVIDA